MSKVELSRDPKVKPTKASPEQKKSLPNKQKLPKEVDKDSLRYLYNERKKLKKEISLAQKEKIAETEVNKSKAKLENFRSEVSEKIIHSLNREDGSKGVEIKEYDFMSYITALTLKGNRIKWDEKVARKIIGGSIAYIEEKGGKRVVIIEYKGKKRVVGTVLEGFEKKKDQKKEAPKSNSPENSNIPKTPTPKLDLPEGELPKSDAKSDTKGDTTSTPETTPAPASTPETAPTTNPETTPAPAPTPETAPTTNPETTPAPAPTQEPAPIPAPAGDSSAALEGVTPASHNIGIKPEDAGRIFDFTKNLGTDK